MKICIDTNIYSAFKNGNKDIIKLLENDEQNRDLQVCGMNFLVMQVRQQKRWCPQPCLHSSILATFHMIAQRRRNTCLAQKQSQACFDKNI